MFKDRITWQEDDGDTIYQMWGLAPGDIDVWKLYVTKYTNAKDKLKMESFYYTQDNGWVKYLPHRIIQPFISVPGHAIIATLSH